MNNLRKYIVAACVLAVGVSAPLVRAEDAPATKKDHAAGDAKRGPGGPGERVNAMKEKLGLTDAQVEQIKPILQDEMQAMKALREDTSIDKDAKKAKMMEIHKSHADQVLAILTPEQQAKFKAGREMHKKADAPKPAPEPAK